MPDTPLARLAKALAAMKQADLAALAGNRAQAAAHRHRAVAARAWAARYRAPTTVSDLRAQALWQAQSERRARDALVTAEELDKDAGPLKEKLALTMGREQALSKLMEEEAREVRRKAELKAEVEAVGLLRPKPSAQFRSSGSASSSDGIA